MNKIKHFIMNIKIHYILLFTILCVCILGVLEFIFIHTRWGMQAQYYANFQWKGEPSVTRIDKVPYLKGKDVYNLLSTNTYSVRWRGWIVIEKTGKYRFATDSDDGSFLDIGENRVVDNGGAHGKTKVWGDIYLKKGVYPLTILYFQVGGYSVMETSWIPLEKTEERIPPELLFSTPPFRIEIFFRQNMRSFRRLLIQASLIILFIFLVIKVLIPSYVLFKKRGLKGYKKEIMLSFGSVISFILFTEVFLRIINFSYFPTDIGFEITSNYKIFEAIGDFYQMKSNKAGIFIPQQFPLKKDKREIRAFIVGGSSAHNLGGADHLKTKLQNQLKGHDKNIRIINISAGGYGTTRLLLHFQEILNYEPDIILLYSGHNEFEEAYVKDKFFKETVLSTLSDKLGEISKLYQFMSLLEIKITQSVLSQNIHLIEKRRHPFFPVDFRVNWDITFDKNDVYKNYRMNIMQMVKLAKNNKIDILISTVTYNRRQPPFKAADDSYALCDSLYNQMDYKKALSCFDDALDADLQPHRATKTSNKIVSEIAKSYNVPLIDVDAKIIKTSQNHVPGFDLFYDHCHLGKEGNIVLQETFFEVIKKTGVLEKYL